MTDKIAVLSTCESEEQARAIARALVEARLAACVNIVPGMHSVYRWKDAVEEAAELLLIIKTSRAMLPRVQAALQRLHTYEVPELVALPIVDGSESYLNWLSASLESEQGGAR
jgi:periplasmic divalent cation tolerance protein